MPDRSKDWFTQAQRDLRHAVHACDSGDHEWSCFSAQQAAEKAVKPVFLYLHGEGWGHSVSRLLSELDEKTAVGQDILDAAKALDKHYIPARYPNSFASGMPGDYYTKKDAQEAIANAEQIIRFCKGLLR
jgi:HEPN domain-containing protein